MLERRERIATERMRGARLSPPSERLEQVSYSCGNALILVYYSGFLVFIEDDLPPMF